MSCRAINSSEQSSAPAVFLGMEQVSSTEFVQAAQKGNFELVQNLIQNGMDVNCKNEKEETALHAAAQNGDLPMVCFLIGSGANVNALNENLQTPLRYAMDSQQVGVVEELLKREADINIKDKWDVSPSSSMVFKDPKTELKKLTNLVGKIDIVESEKSPIDPRKKLQERIQTLYTKNLEAYYKLGKLTKRVVNTKLVETESLNKIDIERKKHTNNQEKLKNKINALRAHNKEIHKEIECITELVRSMKAESDKNLESANILNNLSLELKKMTYKKF